MTSHSLRLSAAGTFLLVLAGCQTVCPAGRDETVDPTGLSCNRDRDCLVECACAEGENRGAIRAGECRGRVCAAPDPLCEEACLPTAYTGDYCFAD